MLMLIDVMSDAFVFVVAFNFVVAVAQSTLFGVSMLMSQWSVAWCVSWLTDLVGAYRE